MRARLLFALALSCGAVAVGVWWTEAPCDDGMRNSGPRDGEVDRTFVDAPAEGATPTPLAASVEAERTKSPGVAVEAKSTPEVPQAASVRVHVVDRDTRSELAHVTMIRIPSAERAVENA